MPWNETTKTQYTRPRDRFESDLTDEEWNLVEPCLPPPAKRGRPRKTNLREVFNAIQQVLATGCQWHAVPPCFPPAATIQYYFYAWSRDGVIDRMTDKLHAGGRALAGRSETPTAAATDTQSVKTTESGGPSGYDAGKKVKGRKRHLVVDVEGLPIEIAVHPASVQDRDGAPAVILRVLEKAPQIRKIWADGGYQGEKLASALKKLGIGSDLEIVKKPKDVKGFTVLYRRWVVERTFAWMSRCRRLAKDCERSLESSLAWAQLAACRFMMRRIARAATC